jgi:hypothetical protein
MPALGMRSGYQYTPPGMVVRRCAKSDFVELYNRSNAFSLNGYSLQYNSQNGGSSYTVAALGGLSIPASGCGSVRVVGL